MEAIAGLDAKGLASVPVRMGKRLRDLAKRMQSLVR